MEITERMLLRPLWPKTWLCIRCISSVCDFLIELFGFGFFLMTWFSKHHRRRRSKGSCECVIAQFYSKVFKHLWWVDDFLTILVYLCLYVSLANVIGFVGSTALASALLKNSTLKTFHFNGICLFRSECLVLFFHVLLGNPIGTAGANANVLKQNPTTQNMALVGT